MSKRTLRGKVAIAGVGETTYYKHGKSPVSEFKLALQAILAACEDAGIDPRRIDGFASYSNDRNEPSRLAAALGLPALRFSNMNWGGGGGGGSAAMGNAAAAVACGMANCVVVFRALAQGQFQRFGAAPPGGTASRRGGAQRTLRRDVAGADATPCGRCASCTRTRSSQSAQRAIALASYHHAQANPRAVMHGRPLTAEAYEVALDRRAVAAVRLLPGERRRGGADRRAGRARPRLQAQRRPTCWARRRAPSTATARAATTRRSTPPRASPRWRRSSTTWPA